eukprot:15432399-Alexandrium_andersonii.AAC.1
MPIFRGWPADADASWDAVSGSVGDRPPAEQGLDPGARPQPDLVGGGVRRLGKSRYGFISCYIHSTSSGERYNVPCEVDE